MIQGKKRIDLTPDAILQRLSDYDIYHFFMGHRAWKINQVTHSVFHRDDSPSFLIGNKNGYLYHVDFSSGQRGGCFDFVMQLYNISLHEALLLIDQQFGLGILPEHDTGEYKRIKAEYKQPEEIGKRYSVIQVITRKFTNEELKYWSDYYQDIQDLRDNHVYSISKVFLNRKLFPLKETELRFGYLYDSCWKIYRPHGTKKEKWVPNNVQISTIEGKENITNCDTLFINKSKKDLMIMKKVFKCSCAVQNESIACFSEENVKFFKDNSKRQILSFDSDIVGVANSQQITKLFDFDYCNVPRQYLSEGIKDWADLGKAYNLQLIEDILKEKQIL
jgi:hypothetical protein